MHPCVVEGVAVALGLLGLAVSLLSLMPRMRWVLGWASGLMGIWAQCGCAVGSWWHALCACAAPPRMQSPYPTRRHAAELQRQGQQLKGRRGLTGLEAGYLLASLFVGLLHAAHGVAALALHLPAFHVMEHATACTSYMVVAWLSLSHAKVGCGCQSAHLGVEAPKAARMINGGCRLMDEAPLLPYCAPHRSTCPWTSGPFASPRSWPTSGPSRHTGACTARLMVGAITASPLLICRGLLRTVFRGCLQAESFSLCSELVSMVPTCITSPLHATPSKPSHPPPLSPSQASRSPTSAPQSGRCSCSASPSPSWRKWTSCGTSGCSSCSWAGRRLDWAAKQNPSGCLLRREQTWREQLWREQVGAAAAAVLGGACGSKTWQQSGIHQKECLKWSAAFAHEGHVAGPSTWAGL